MAGPLEILLISGSLRAGSVNTAVLRTAASLADEGIRATLYEGLGELPHFNPDDDPEGGPVHLAVADLRRQLREADAVLLCTPEYASALPGSLKNLLDWTVGGGETYGKPVAWINASSRPQPDGAGAAHESLRAVLGYTGVDLVDPACRRICVPRSAIGTDGLVADAAIREQIAGALTALADHVESVGMSTPGSRAELPLACTLGPNDGSARLRRWQHLADAASPSARRDGHRLEVRYHAGPGVREELEALAVAEAECCSFVSWTVTQDGDHTVLHVTAQRDTPDAVAPIAALFGVP